MTYGNLHRLVLRTVASRGVLSLTDVYKIIEKFPDVGGNIPDIVKEINDEIRPYQQEIKLTSNEVTNEEVLVFMSLGYDDATKSQNMFSGSELEYFRILIEQIMTTECRQITSVLALSLIKSLSKSEAQRLLNTWCRMYYLEKEGNNYALGVRAVHEFEGYLRENMPDTIEECSLCKKIVFRGYNCPGCALAIHTRCLNNYLLKVQKWPCCKIDFNIEQLEKMNQESSRLEHTQQFTQLTQQSVAYDQIETAPNEETQEDQEMFPQDMPELSQRVNKKRKRFQME